MLVLDRLSTVCKWTLLSHMLVNVISVQGDAQCEQAAMHTNLQPMLQTLS